MNQFSLEFIKSYGPLGAMQMAPLTFTCAKQRRFGVNICPNTLVILSIEGMTLQGQH